MKRLVSICGILFCSQVAQAQSVPIFVPPQHPIGWYNHDTVYMVDAWPPKVRKRHRGDLHVKAKTWEAAMFMLAQGARDMKANGVLWPHRTDKTSSIDGFIEMAGEAVFFPDPKEIIASGYQYAMR